MNANNAYEYEIVWINVKFMSEMVGALLYDAANQGEVELVRYTARRIFVGADWRVFWRLHIESNTNGWN